MTVQISPNIKKESVRIDANTNEIDPKTKRVIKPADVPYVPAPEDVAKVEPAQEKPEEKPVTLSGIKEAIKKVETYLEELKELKKQKVEEMKKELEEAE